jgi:hypothetical protein
MERRREEMRRNRAGLEPPMLRLLALVCAVVGVDTVFFSALATGR